MFTKKHFFLFVMKYRRQTFVYLNYELAILSSTMFGIFWFCNHMEILFEMYLQLDNFEQKSEQNHFFTTIFSLVFTKTQI